MPLEMALDLAVLGLYDIFIYAGGFSWNALNSLQPAVAGCTCMTGAVMLHGDSAVGHTPLGWSVP